MIRLSRILKNIYFRQNLRFLSPSKIHYKDEPSKALNNFSPIYKFEYIRVLSIVNRLKFYSTVLTTACIPGTFMLNELEVIDTECLIYSAVIGLTTSCSLHIVGLLANKFIGFIYLNRKDKCLRIAFIDFWGRREDLDIPINDIVPFSEIPTSIMDYLYMRFCRISNEETFKVNFKYGTILDKDSFKEVFPLT